MPNQKEIELQSMELSPPFKITNIFLSMREFAEEINRMIERAFEILEDPEKGALSYDHRGEDNVYRMQRIAPNQFGFWNAKSDTIKVLSTQQALCKLYEHMPYVEMVGTEMKMDILGELAERQRKNGEGSKSE